MRFSDSCLASCFYMQSFFCFPGAGIPGRKRAKLLLRHERERSGIQLAFWRHVPTRKFGIPSYPYHCYQCWPTACFQVVGWRDVSFHAFVSFLFQFHSIFVVCLQNTPVNCYELCVESLVDLSPKALSGPLFPVVLPVPPHRGWQQTSRLQRCNFESKRGFGLDQYIKHKP